MTASSRSTHRRAGNATLAAAVLLAAAGLPAPAQADSLSPGRPVTPPGTIVDDFSLATSPAGGRVALLYAAQAGGGTGQQLLFARLGLGRNLGPVRRLEDRRSDSGRRQVTVFSSRVAVSSDNAAVAAWVARGREAGRDQLRVAIAPRGRGFGPAQTLARVRGRRGYVPSVTVTGLVAGAHGRVVVAWSLGGPGKPSMHAAVRTPGRGFGAPQRLGTVGFASSVPPALALAPSGAVLTAWMLRGSDDRASVRAATLRPGGRRFGASQLVSGADDADDVGLFAGPGGAAVTWSNRRPAAGRLMPLRMARVRRDGTLGAPQTFALVERGPQSLEVDGLQLGFPLAGPVAAWQVFNDISEAGDGNKDQTRIDTMIGRGANVFHAPQTRTAPGVQTGLPVVAALADRMLLAWPERVGADTWHLRLAAHPSGGDWGPTRTFADLDGSIAMAASRRSALVLWQPFQPYAEQRVLQLAVYRP
jgi:hypothetical protein